MKPTQIRKKNKMKINVIFKSPVSPGLFFALSFFKSNKFNNFTVVSN